MCIRKYTTPSFYAASFHVLIFPSDLTDRRFLDLSHRFHELESLPYAVRLRQSGELRLTSTSVEFFGLNSSIFTNAIVYIHIKIKAHTNR